MSKTKEILKNSAMIILGGLLIPALLSIIFSGFQFNVVSIVSFQFFVGLIIALVGGIMIIYDFFRYRGKVLRTPTDLEVDNEVDTTKMDWRYVLLCTGLIIVVIAFALGEI